MSPAGGRAAAEQAEAHYNLGHDLRPPARMEEAEACYRQAVACGPTMRRPTTTWATSSGTSNASPKPNRIAAGPSS